MADQTLPKFQLHHSNARTKRGMKGHAVMELQPWLDDTDKAAFPLGIYFAREVFHTAEEAAALFATLTKEA